MDTSSAVLELLLATGEAVCRKVRHSLLTQSQEERSAVYAEAADDTIYQIDREVEHIIVPLLAEGAESVGGLVLLAEGIGDEEGPLVLPAGMPAEQAAWRILMDPIDGTRGIMYDKRPAFFLAGAAPNRGEKTRLADISVAVMTELPTSRSWLSDTFWAIKGRGCHGFTLNLQDNSRTERLPQPSKANTILGGFGQIARFFPPGRDLLAKIEEEMIVMLYPELPVGRAPLFEDQYICSGGQLYQILCGHDRYVADIRTALYAYLATKGKPGGHVCHPYDLCAWLVGAEAGLVIIGPDGSPLDAPFDTQAPVDWMAFANKQLFDHIFPVLKEAMRQNGL